MDLLLHMHKFFSTSHCETGSGVGISGASCTSSVDVFYSISQCNHLSYIHVNTSCNSGNPHTLLLTGWRRRSPSGRRCGPWRGRRPPSSRHGGCTGTHLGCSTVGCRPGSWGRCEHCQEKQQTYKNMLRLIFTLSSSLLDKITWHFMCFICILTYIKYL